MELHGNQLFSKPISHFILFKAPHKGNIRYRNARDKPIH